MIRYPMDMMFSFEPVLFLRRCEPDNWALTAVICSDKLPSFALPQEPSEFQSRTMKYAGFTFHVFDFKLRRNGVSRYICNEIEYRVAVPEQGESINISLTACNGSECENLKSPRPGRENIWQIMWENHQTKPYHVLLQGGDQIYNDAVWDSHPMLKAWSDRLPWSRYRAEFSTEMLAAARQFYAENYLQLWSLPIQAKLQASIPSLMMWDDHDIFDGYGSYRGYDSNSAVVKGLFGAAKEAFRIFQTPQYPWEDHAGVAVKIDKLGILIPDLRTQRTRHQVLGAVGWEFIHKSLKSFQDCRQVILVMTVPFINTDLSLIERILIAPPGQQMYQDDLRDQWRSFGHRNEWQKLAHTLMDFVEQSSAELTLLSGEIHLGAKGFMSRGNTTINQLITPGIAHPPPPKKLVRFLNYLAKESVLDGTFKIGMSRNSNGETYIPENGYISMQAAETFRY